MQIAERLPAWRVTGLRWLRAAERYEPWVVLVPILVAQLLALLAFALTVRHNGWLYYQGGDETFYYTTSWLLSGWHLPTTPIGYGWSYLLTPVALFAGPSFLTGLPVILLVNTLVLLPVATLCVYGIAARIGGRAIGYLATLLWVIAPYAVIPLWDQRYHQKWVELSLPQMLGLTNLGDFPSMVCVLIAAYFAFRALDRDDLRDAIAAGLALGFAVGIKPANSIFVPAPVLALLLARRWRGLGALAAGAAPALITLAVWKSRGLGFNPAVSAGDPQLAYTGLVGVTDPFTKYVHVHWHMLGRNFDVLREFFWSVRPLEYLPIAGAVAVSLRSLPKGVFLIWWFFAFFFIKGSSSHASVEDASFFRLMMPAFPGYLLLASSLPLLVPTYGRELADRHPPKPPRRLGNRRLGVATAVFALIPLVIVLATPPLRGPTAIKVFPDGLFVPIDRSFRPAAAVAGQSVRLTWPTRNASGVTVSYRIIRAPAFRPDPITAANPPIIEGMKCPRRSGGAGVTDCSFFGTLPIGFSATNTFTDKPGPGRWTYYVGVVSNWLAEPSFGDIFVLSPAVDVSVPRVE